MRLLLLKVAFLLSFFISIAESQFYRGELEPRYSRKTPFRQQTDIPDPVFGIGHGIRRFNGDKSSQEEQPLSPFFGERREPGNRNSGREDGRDYEENGDEENRFGRRRPFGFGRHGSPEEEEERRDGPFQRQGHDFKRPNLPDPTDVKNRFDKERKQKTMKERKVKKKRIIRSRQEEEKDQMEKTMVIKDERRPRRPLHRNRDRDEENEEKEEDHRRNYRPRHEDLDREREHNHRQNKDEETENIAETPSKVVGLNMQMVAGVYPKEKKGAVVEDVDKRGGRFVDKPDEREQNKFFRGSESDNENENRRDDVGRREEKGSEEPRDRRPARGDSGESEKRSGGENSESGDEQSRKERRNEESEEKRNRDREPQRPSPQQQQQQQQQAPPPPKPQIPPFPAFPKFPSFGGFQPFQPDFPTRSFGGNGGFTGGPWNESGRPSGRQTAPREDVGSSEDRLGPDGRRVYQQNPSSTSSDNSGSHDDSAERRHSTGDNSKENERGRTGENEKRDRNEEEKRDGREHSDSREENKPSVAEKINNEEQALSTPIPRKDFPNPGRFVTNIRAKKSGEIFDATTSPPTTSTTSLPTAITFPSTSSPPMIPSTTTEVSTGIMLPTEAIVTKLRSIVNQKIKVA
uniref:Filaggrin n=1 Tax=Caenorhabditis tropicalis TaxID=1561998 RepID=A0A1I7T7Z5_9PELO